MSGSTVIDRGAFRATISDDWIIISDDCGEWIDFYDDKLQLLKDLIAAVEEYLAMKATGRDT